LIMTTNAIGLNNGYDVIGKRYGAITLNICWAYLFSGTRI
jgi:hypothetical protein